MGTTNDSLRTSYDIGQATNVGLVRERNEDAFGWFTLEEGELFIVADGMGGHAGGAEASRRAVQAFCNYLKDNAAGTPKERLNNALLYADKAVSNIGMAHPELRGCGSTIVALFLTGDAAYHIHAGDSRCYVLSQGKLRQLGRDHSAVQDMLAAGIISPEEAAKSPKNVITQSLGGNVDPQRCLAEEIPLSNCELFMLCTDGLWGCVSDAVLCRVASSSKPAEGKARALVEAALNAGGPDNVTVQIVSVAESGLRNSESSRKTIMLQPPQKKRRKWFWLFLLMVSAVLLGMALGWKLHNWFSHDIKPTEIVLPKNENASDSPQTGIAVPVMPSAEEKQNLENLQPSPANDSGNAGSHGFSSNTDEPQAGNGKNAIEPNQKAESMEPKAVSNPDKEGKGKARR